MRFIGKVILGSLLISSDVLITAQTDFVMFSNSAKILEEIRAEVAKVDRQRRRRAPPGKETVWVHGYIPQRFKLRSSFVRAFDLTLFTASLIGEKVDVRNTQPSGKRRRLNESLSSFPGYLFSQATATAEEMAKMMYGAGVNAYNYANDTWNWLRGISPVPGEESFVIKYVDNCASEKSCPRDGKVCDLSKIDPLVNEFVFAKLISLMTERVTAVMIGISPKFTPMFYELGGDGIPPTGVSTMFVINDKEATCSGATARFIVEQRVGESVNSIMNRFFDGKDKSFDAKQKIILATKIFSDGMYLLNEIHKLGIIHGDIHPGNLALLDYRRDPLTQLGIWIKKMTGINTLTLIDFGKAQFILEITSESSKVDEGMNLMLLSPWHLKGEQLGPKDDVFRMFEIYLNLLSHQGLADYYASIPSGDAEYPVTLADAKLSPGLLSHLTLPPQAAGIKAELKELRSCVSEDATNYTEINSITSRILSKLTTQLVDELANAGV